MADPAFFVDGAFAQLASDLFAEFGVDAILRRRTYAPTIGDARSQTENPAQDIAIKVVDGGAAEQFGVTRPIRNVQSVFFAGFGLAVTPDAEKDSIILKRPDGQLTDELKVTEYVAILRGLESVILWEAVRET